MNRSEPLDLSWFTTPQLHTHSDQPGTVGRSADTTVSELVIIGQHPIGWPTDNLPQGSVAFEDGYFGLWIKPTFETGPGYTEAYNPTPNDHKIDILVTGQRGIDTAIAAAKIIAKIDQALLNNMSEMGTVNARVGREYKPRRLLRGA